MSRLVWDTASSWIAWAVLLVVAAIGITSMIMAAMIRADRLIAKADPVDKIARAVQCTVCPPGRTGYGTCICGTDCTHRDCAGVHPGLFVLTARDMRWLRHLKIGEPK